MQRIQENELIVGIFLKHSALGTEMLCRLKLHLSRESIDFFPPASLPGGVFLYAYHVIWELIQPAMTIPTDCESIQPYGGVLPFPLFVLTEPPTFRAAPDSFFAPVRHHQRLSRIFIFKTNPIGEILPVRFFLPFIKDGFVTHAVRAFCAHATRPSDVPDRKADRYLCKDLPCRQAVFKTLPVNCIGKFHHRMVRGNKITQQRIEQISSSSSRELLLVIILPAFFRFSKSFLQQQLMKNHVLLLMLKLLNDFS